MTIEERCRKLSDDLNEVREALNKVEITLNEAANEIDALKLSYAALCDMIKRKQ